MQYHLAQVNIGRFIEPIHSPANKDFVDNLDRINALAESASGFVWRLTGESNNALDVSVSQDSHLAMNLSVWESTEALYDFVYKNNSHLEIMKRRREWFEKMRFYMALWWIPAGLTPTTNEALNRIAHIEKYGSTAISFNFAKPFPPPDDI